MNLVIVSGLSGSGKSVALETLEDCGYYCIDNLPVTLLEPFLHQVVSPTQNAFRRTAISIDARSQKASLDQFPSSIELARGLGIQARILFLKADQQTLLKRFSETRRKHPLTNAGFPLAKAIEMECEILEPVCSRADVLVDTTRTNVRQLRELIRDRFDTDAKPLMSIYFQSFGFKHGIPLDTDFVFDVRCLPNPYWEPALREKSGRDVAVADFLDKSEEVARYVEDVASFLSTWIPRFHAENRSYLTISIGCTGGQHRSVYVAEKLSQRFVSGAWHVSVRHREIGDKPGP